MRGHLAMIPDIHLDTLSVGPVRVQPFGLLLVLGLVVMHTVLARRARGLASPAVVEGFAIALGAGGIAAAFAAERIAGGISMAFAAAGAVAAGSVYVAVLRLDALGFADAAAGAFPFGWAIARLGCALVHDHLGPPSRSLLAVAFATGPRLDLGLLEWLLTPALFVAVALGTRRRHAGAVAGAVAVTYALIRFPLDGLRVGDARFGGLTAAQWGAIPLLAVGVALLAGLSRRDQGQPVSRNET
ncbi:MAG: prolipoprotein diacylglyceryl transferase [Minicystis sp.]